MLVKHDLLAMPWNSDASFMPLLRDSSFTWQVSMLFWGARLEVKAVTLSEPLLATVVVKGNFAEVKP